MDIDPTPPPFDIPSFRTLLEHTQIENKFRTVIETLNASGGKLPLPCPDCSGSITPDKPSCPTCLGYGAIMPTQSVPSVPELRIMFFEEQRERDLEQSLDGNAPNPFPESGSIIVP